MIQSRDRQTFGSIVPKLEFQFNQRTNELSAVVRVCHNYKLNTVGLSHLGRNLDLLHLDFDFITFSYLASGSLCGPLGPSQ